MTGQITSGKCLVFMRRRSWNSSGRLDWTSTRHRLPTSLTSGQHNRSRDNLAVISNRSLDVMRAVIDGMCNDKNTPAPGDRANAITVDQSYPVEVVPVAATPDQGPKVITPDDLTPTASVPLEAIGDLGAIDSRSAKRREDIAARAKTGNHYSEHIRIGFRQLSDLRWMIAKRRAAHG